MSRNRRRCAVLAGALLLVPSALLAHARLLSSSPAQGAVLSTAPAEVRLAFSERVALALASVRLVAGRDTLEPASLALDSTDRRSIVATFPVTSNAGPYRIIWRIASRDGHLITGTIDFTVATPSSTVQPADSALPMPASPAELEETGSGTIAIAGALGSIVVRWAAFISLFAMIGTIMFRFVILARASGGSFAEIASTNAATLGFASALVFLMATLLKVARESSDMPDVPMATMLTASSWGCAMIAQMIGASAAAIGFRAAHSSRASTRSAGWTAAAGSSAVIALALPFTGHAFGGDRAWIAVPADIVHLLAGATWMGTLASIVIVGIPAAFKSPDDARPGARVAAMVNAFSPVALMSGGIIVATGIGSSLIRLGGLGNLRTTPYGGALMLKLLFVVFLFGAGAWNWRRIKPRLTTDEAVVPLRKSAALELSIAAIVLAVTAVLVALELP